MRNEALWKRAARAGKQNVVFTPSSPTTLEYFLYFEKKAVKLLSLSRLSLPRHTGHRAPSTQHTACLCGRQRSGRSTTGCKPLRGAPAMKAFGLLSSLMEI